MEQRWKAETERCRPSQKKLKRIALAGYWFVVGFCSDFRGEENGLIEFEGALASLDNLVNPGEGMEKHFESVIAGRTKGNSISGAKFGIPCAAVTGKTKWQPGIWAMRYCRLLKLGGQKGGYLFPGALSDYEDMFYSMLESIQAS